MHVYSSLMVCDLSFLIRRWQQPSLLSLPSIFSDNPTNRILGFPINGKLLLWLLLTIICIHMEIFIWMFLYKYLQGGLRVLAEETSQLGDSSDPDIKISKEKSILLVAGSVYIWHWCYFHFSLMSYSSFCRF